MTNSKLVFAVGLLLVLVTPVSATQDYTARLETVLAQIKARLAEQKPEWKHRSIEPIEGSRNVSVNNWEFPGEGGVRVSIIAYGSAEQAAESTRRYRSESSALHRFPDLGDGGYSWGADENICFRKADLIICISTITPDQKDAVKITQEVARLIDAALTSQIESPKLKGGRK